MPLSFGSRRLSIEAPDFLRDKRRLLLIAIILALAVGLAYGLLLRQATDGGGGQAAIGVTVGSTPTGAVVLVDGKERGRTPATLALPPGDRRITLRRDGYMDATFPLALADGAPPTRLDVALWLRTPHVRRIRPPLPGASIVDARFLDDGRVALVTASPPGDERQAWIVDPSGDARRIGRAARTAVAVSPDGQRVASLARAAVQTTGGPGSGDPRATEFWIAERDGKRGERRFALPLGAAAPDERLLDLTWAPDGRHLLLVSQLRLPGGDGVRTRLLWHDTTAPLGPTGQGDMRELVTLPSDAAPGSWVWQPGGGQVAFLSRAAGRIALCLLGTPLGDPPGERPDPGAVPFRYLADLGGEPSPRVAPLAWAPTDGPARVAYPGPVESAVGGLFGGGNRGTAIFVGGLDGEPAERLAPASGLAPAWRPDGLITTLVPTKRNGPLVTRLVAADGASVEGTGVSLAGGSPDGVRWDLARARALVTVPGVGSGVGADGFDLWLLQWAEEGAR